jgi:hypothetical protein
MNTWHGELICGLCGENARPTYPVIDGKVLGVICGRCDFRMTPTAAEWELEHGQMVVTIEKLARDLAA